MRLIPLSCLLLVVAPTLTYGGLFTQQCQEQYHQGDYAKALEACHNALNDPDARFVLGKIYSIEGMASPQMQKAYEHFSAAANMNHPEAQFMIALCYQNGLGVRQNSRTASYWYKQAIEHGFQAPLLRPQWDRGTERMNAEGLPGGEEYLAAMELFKKGTSAEQKETGMNLLTLGANQGNAQAQYQLGKMYSIGTLLPQDDGKAHHWLSQAAAQNHQGAQSYLAWMCMLGLGKEANAQEAVRWFVQAKQKTHHQAHAHDDELDKLFGSLKNDADYLVYRSRESEYLQGKELVEAEFSPQDVKDGLTLLEKAAEQNFAPAQLYLAKLYHSGNTVTQDLAQAAKWYKAAAANNLPEAQYALGWMYFYGEGVKQNDERAFQFLNLAYGNESRAKEALLFMEEQREPIEIGTPPSPPAPLKVKWQRATHYLKSLLPGKKSTS